MLVAVLPSACNQGIPTAEATVGSTPARPVRLSTVKRGDIERPLRASGLVRSRQEADLSFKVGGIVTTVLVDDGARVKKGQVIARVDPTEYSAGTEQARQGLAQAEKELARTRELNQKVAGPAPLTERWPPLPTVRFENSR